MTGRDESARGRRMRGTTRSDHQPTRPRRYGAAVPVRWDHERAPGHGHRGGVRHLGAGATARQPDGGLVAGRSSAYASATIRARRARWDLEEESPLRDARGFDMSRQVADPSQLTDEDMGLANVVSPTGVYYIDHAHPEYSTPEVTNPLDIVRSGQGGGAGDARRGAASQ